MSLSKRLPAEVDLMMPDYSLYPDCDFDVGFTTRGCVRSCPFCVVPRKEGRFKVVQHPREFHDPSHKGVMLLDNNILADKNWFFEVTDWINSQGLKVDFNQGLDLRLMDKDIAKRIRELGRMTTWRFAFDSLDYTDEVIDGIRMLRDAGVKVRSSSLTYVYMDSDDDFDSALERLRILRGLDAMPYVMLNRNSQITPRMRALKRWTRPQIFYSTEWEGYDVSVRGHNADRNQEGRDDRLGNVTVRCDRHNLRGLHVLPLSQAAGGVGDRPYPPPQGDGLCAVHRQHLDRRDHGG